LTTLEQSPQGFDSVGSLSRIFARYYALHTMKEGEVVQLRASARPGWFGPLVENDECGALPLWRLSLQPNYAKLLPDQATRAPHGDGE
jgi:hypothetical protein